METASTYLAAQPKFEAGQYESRFAVLRQDLPKDAVVGYLTDLDMNLAGPIGEYYLAQYALSPTVVANSADQKLLIVNVHSPQPSAFYESRGLQMVRDYGNGLMVMRKTSR